MTIDVSTVPSSPATPRSAKVDRAAYLANLLQLRSEVNLPAWLQQRRDQAAAIVQELAIPSPRDEDWRFTDLSGLLGLTWQAADPSARWDAIADMALPEAEGSRLVCVNGEVSSDGSDLSCLPTGVWVGKLGQLSSEQVTQLQPYLAKQQGTEEVFTALNTASLRDVVVIWVPRQLVLEQPIHVVLLSHPTAAATLCHPRCLVIAEAGSCFTLVEEYRSAPGRSGALWTNAVTEVYLAEAAQVRHVRLQRESLEAFHIGKTAVSQGQDSQYAGTAVSLGANLSRHHLEIYHTGEQAQTNLMGLSYVDGDRIADTHSLIAFTRPAGSANQLHKCIASEKGHGVFNGRICVPQAAQQTNAAQLSRNLLLSNQARIDTKPQLEIVADNVKCAHGATVSQLDDDEVFYLQTRGIDAAAARRLLTVAFAQDVIESIPVESLRQILNQWVRSHTL
jgi:Fe-S cluster assembly protein SufD